MRSTLGRPFSRGDVYPVPFISFINTCELNNLDLIYHHIELIKQYMVVLKETPFNPKSLLQAAEIFALINALTNNVQ